MNWEKDLSIFVSFIIGIIIGAYIPYLPQSFFILFIGFLITYLILNYFTLKYNLLPTGRLGNPIKTIKKYQKYNIGKFLLLAIFIWIGIIIGILFKLFFMSIL